MDQTDLLMFLCKEYKFKRICNTCKQQVDPDTITCGCPVVDLFNCTDVPDKTPGTIMAEELRAKANKLTDEERAYHLKRAIDLIH